MKYLTRAWFSTFLSVVMVEVAHRAPDGWHLLAYAVLAFYRLALDAEAVR